MLTGLNHITLSVKDLELSLYFYHKVLGFKAHAKWDKGAYLSLPGLWLCLSQSQEQGDSDDIRLKQTNQDYTHLAFSLDARNFEALIFKLCEMKLVQWQKNSSEGQSYYFLDPDGHKLELHLGSLMSRLESLREEPYEGLVWL